MERTVLSINQRPLTRYSDAVMITDSTRVKVSPNQVSSKLGDEAVVLHFENGIYFGLNEVSARIMELIAEPKTVSEIVDVLTSEYDVDTATCRKDVIDLLIQLQENDLIDVD